MDTKVVNSFSYFLEQVKQETKHLFAGSRDILALVGTIYAMYKAYQIVARLTESIQVHLLGQRHIRWVDKYGPWAVVTGGSEGVGRAYAFELAKKGLNIVLISRNEQKLKTAKDEIEADCSVQVEYVVADFTDDDQNRLYKLIAERLAGKGIGLLINNVGVMYDYPDVLLNISQDKLWQLIRVNVGAATMMTHLLLPQMVKRGHGGVVVVSSGSSTQITPLMTVYSATKRYLDYFIEGLAYEYRDSGVTFQCLNPFYIATHMTEYSQRLSHAGFLVPRPDVFAKSALNTLGKSARSTGYYPHTIQLWISKCIPSWMWMWSSEKVNLALKSEAVNRLTKQSQTECGENKDHSRQKTD